MVRTDNMISSAREKVNEKGVNFKKAKSHKHLQINSLV